MAASVPFHLSQIVTKVSAHVAVCSGVWIGGPRSWWDSAAVLVHFQNERVGHAIVMEMRLEILPDLQGCQFCIILLAESLN